MAEAPRGTFVPPVEADTLWKDTIIRYRKTQLFIWPDRWSFLVDEYKKLREALEGKRAVSPFDENRPIPKCSMFLKPKTEEDGHLPPIHSDSQTVAKFSRHLPETSSGWYGHRHLKDGRNLVMDRQKWVKQDVRQHDLIKLLKWPMDFYD